ncbi:hypothetical protein JM93_00906 [Roseibium hamelinense]|uniref:Uncharacterized protein n=1 Tax=Roseibium hamelinense TaxID=150831 RepID=A0A562TK95_9HYPH|nr:hypothetical protein JM93_00906 [Roseibium hamelinense]
MGEGKSPSRRLRKAGPLLRQPLAASALTAREAFPLHSLWGCGRNASTHFIFISRLGGHGHSIGLLCSCCHRGCLWQGRAMSTVPDGVQCRVMHSVRLLVRACVIVRLRPDTDFQTRGVSVAVGANSVEHPQPQRVEPTESFRDHAVRTGWLSVHADKQIAVHADQVRGEATRSYRSAKSAGLSPHWQGSGCFDWGGVLQSQALTFRYAGSQ